MRFAMFCYAPQTGNWTKEMEEAVMEQHNASEARLEAAGKLGPHLRLMPTTTAVTVRAGDEPLVLDGPFAETKEVLLGFWLFDAASLDEAIGIAREFSSHTPYRGGALELRPVRDFDPGSWRT
jgi:hypothetical protein